MTLPKMFDRRKTVNCVCVYDGLRSMINKNLTQFRKCKNHFCQPWGNWVRKTNFRYLK